MSSNVGSAVFFVRWKANFLSCQGANKNQMHTVTLHQAAGLSVAESNRGQSDKDWETGRESAMLVSLGCLYSFFLPHNEVGKESLCIGLINSYSSSAWHPGNRSGFALGLIFRPVEDSQSIRALFRLHTPNFLDLPKKRGEENKEMREWLKREWMTKRERWREDKVERKWEGKKR